MELAQEHLLPQPRCQDTGTDPKPAGAEHPMGDLGDLGEEKIFFV